MALLDSFVGFLLLCLVYSWKLSDAVSTRRPQRWTRDLYGISWGCPAKACKQGRQAVCHQVLGRAFGTGMGGWQAWPGKSKKGARMIVYVCLDHAWMRCPKGTASRFLKARLWQSEKQDCLYPPERSFSIIFLHYFPIAFPISSISLLRFS